MMACSFEKTGAFNTKASPLEIVFDEHEKRYLVHFIEEGEEYGERSFCDGCPGVEEPMCVRYCREWIEMRRLVDTYRQILKSRCENEE